MRFIAGDPLRGLAALGVVLFHVGAVALIVADRYSQVGGTRDGWSRAWGSLLGPLLAGGSSGIRVFFALSGYLIARPFIAAYAFARPLPPVAPYLVNRALRLLPALWLAFGVGIAWTGLHGASADHVLRVLVLSESWGHSRFDPILGQAWTLNIEARFYVVVPVVAGALVLLTRLTRRPRTARARLLLVVAAALVVSAVELWVTRGRYLDPFHTWQQAHNFLLGVALAGLEMAFGWRWLRTGAGRALAAAVFLAGFVVFARTNPLLGPATAWAGDDWHVPFEVGLLLATGALVGAPLLLQRAGGGCWRALDNPVLHWLGRRSYGLYLFHLMILFQLGRSAPDPELYKRTGVFLAAVGIPLALLAAELSWRLVERPALRLKARARVAAPAPTLATPAAPTAAPPTA